MTIYAYGGNERSVMFFSVFSQFVSIFLERWSQFLSLNSEWTENVEIKKYYKSKL